LQEYSPGYWSRLERDYLIGRTAPVVSNRFPEKRNATRASHSSRIADRCPACLLSRLTRESVLRVGRVLEEHNLPCTLPIMILKIIDLQSWRRPAAQSCRGEDFLRRPQRPGIHYASNAFWETLRQFTLENRRKPLVCHNAFGRALRTSHASNANTLREVGSVRKKKLTRHCAEAVQDGNFLWKAQEKRGKIPA